MRRLELREFEAAHNISLIDYVLETQCSFGVRQYAFFFFFASCRIEPGPLAVKALSPNHWTTREFPIICHFLSMGAWSFLKRKIYLFGCLKSSLQHVNSWLWHVGFSSVTRGQTHACCIGSIESKPLDHQESPRNLILICPL